MKRGEGEGVGSQTTPESLPPPPLRDFGMAGLQRYCKQSML